MDALKDDPYHLFDFVSHLKLIRIHASISDVPFTESTLVDRLSATSDGWATFAALDRSRQLVQRRSSTVTSRSAQRTSEVLEDRANGSSLLIRTERHLRTLIGTFKLKLPRASSPCSC